MDWSISTTFLGRKPKVKVGEMNEKELAEACCRNNRQAQREVYRRYAKAMLNTATRIMGNREEGEDALQEAFLTAFRKMDSFRGDSTLGAWLKRIVVNTSLNMLKGSRSADFEESFDEYEDTTAFKEDTVKLEVARVKEAIEKLPDGYRSVLTLYLLEGYDHIEIGEVLGISASTSKSQYMRAKKKLQHILNTK